VSPPEECRANAGGPEKAGGGAGVAAAGATASSGAEAHAAALPTTSVTEDWRGVGLAKSRSCARNWRVCRQLESKASALEAETVGTGARAGGGGAWASRLREPVCGLRGSLLLRLAGTTAATASLPRASGAAADAGGSGGRAAAASRPAPASPARAGMFKRSGTPGLEIDCGSSFAE